MESITTCIFFNRLADSITFQCCSPDRIPYFYHPTYSMPMDFGQSVHEWKAEFSITIQASKHLEQLVPKHFRSF